MNLWLNWINQNFTKLSQGIWLLAPNYLPHPSLCSFKNLVFAENHKQLWNYGLSLSDGSRIHVHEHVNGNLIVHRDKFDPSNGPLLENNGNLSLQLYVKQATNDVEHNVEELLRSVKSGQQKINASLENLFGKLKDIGIKI